MCCAPRRVPCRVHNDVAWERGAIGADKDHRCLMPTGVQGMRKERAQVCALSRQISGAADALHGLQRPGSRDVGAKPAQQVCESLALVERGIEQHTAAKQGHSREALKQVTELRACTVSVRQLQGLWRSERTCSATCEGAWARGSIRTAARAKVAAGCAPMPAAGRVLHLPSAGYFATITRLAMELGWARGRGSCCSPAAHPHIRRTRKGGHNKKKVNRRELAAPEPVRATWLLWGTMQTVASVCSRWRGCWSRHRAAGSLGTSFGVHNSISAPICCKYALPAPLPVRTRGPTHHALTDCGVHILSCYECVAKWAAVSTSCPTCRSPFSELTLIDREGDVVDSVVFKRMQESEEEDLSEVEANPENSEGSHSEDQDADDGAELEEYVEFLDDFIVPDGTVELEEPSSSRTTAVPSPSRRLRPSTLEGRPCRTRRHLDGPDKEAEECAEDTAVAASRRRFLDNLVAQRRAQREAARNRPCFRDMLPPEEDELQPDSDVSAVAAGAPLSGTRRRSRRVEDEHVLAPGRSMRRRLAGEQRHVCLPTLVKGAAGVGGIDEGEAVAAMELDRFVYRTGASPGPGVSSRAAGSGARGGFCGALGGVSGASSSEDGAMDFAAVGHMSMDEGLGLETAGCTVAACRAVATSSPHAMQDDSRGSASLRSPHETAGNELKDAPGGVVKTPLPWLGPVRNGGGGRDGEELTSPVVGSLLPPPPPATAMRDTNKVARRLPQTHVSRQVILTP